MTTGHAHLHPVPTMDRRADQLWTHLGRGMGYTDTPTKRRAILRATQQADFTTPYAYWRLQKPHLSAVAAAALAGAQLRRAALIHVPRHPGWWLLVLDDLTDRRHYLLDLGAEALHVLTETTPTR